MVCTGLRSLQGPHFLPQAFPPPGHLSSPPQKVGMAKTKPSQGPTDGSRPPEPQRPRNRLGFQRSIWQQPPGPRQSTAPEVRTWDCPCRGQRRKEKPGASQLPPVPSSPTPVFLSLPTLVPLLLALAPLTLASRQPDTQEPDCRVHPWQPPPTHPPGEPSRAVEAHRPL